MGRGDGGGGRGLVAEGGGGEEWGRLVAVIGGMKILGTFLQVTLSHFRNRLCLSNENLLNKF